MLTTATNTAVFRSMLVACMLNSVSVTRAVTVNKTERGVEMEIRERENNALVCQWKLPWKLAGDPLPPHASSRRPIHPD
jgi:hypothetical protein